MAITAENLIVEVTHEIGEVAGAGVQLYSEDLILARLRRTFDIVFKKRFWLQYFKWYQVSLAGANGLIASDALQYIKDFEDFRVIFRSGENTPLPTLPTTQNPYLLSGTRVRYYNSLNAVSDLSNATKKLRFWPLSSVGDLVIGAREYPYVEGGGQPIVPATVIYFDQSLMVHGTAWQCLKSDGLNSEHAETQKELFDLRYSEITKGLAELPISLGGSNTTSSTEWWAR